MLFTTYIGSSLASAPVITEQPQDVRVDRGSPATLSCGVYGDPVPEVTWYKDGEKVLTGAGDHTVLLPGGSLFFLRTLHNHRSRDSGVYTCRAENKDGVVHSNPATLTVTCKFNRIIKTKNFHSKIIIFFTKLLKDTILNNAIKIVGTVSV